jgi:hypothetical protein
MSTTTQRQQLAALRPSGEAYKHHTYWFADVRNGRSHACDCPDYFHRNIVAGEPSHLCRHLRELAIVAMQAIHSAVNTARDGNVDEIADALGIPHPVFHAYQSVYVDGKLDDTAAIRYARSSHMRLVS